MKREGRWMLWAVAVIVIRSAVGESCAAEDPGKRFTYACVPVAASTTLQFFGVPHTYREIYAEMHVDAQTGRASLEDLVSACESRGLHCQAYRRVGVKDVGKWLRMGCVVVVHVATTKTQHAIAHFGINKRIAAYDGLHPLHYVNTARLKGFLSRDAVVVVIRDQPIPDSKGIIASGLGMSLAAALLLAGLWFYTRKKETIMIIKGTCLVMIVASLGSLVAYTSPEAVSMQELQAILAAECPDECCNATGGDDCTGAGNTQCPSEPLDGSKILLDGSFENSGSMCTSTTSTSWADTGEDNADCDSAWGTMWGQQTCSMLSTTIFCSQYKQASCVTNYNENHYAPPRPPERIYYCDEQNVQYIAQNNNSRTQCTGDTCWW